MAFETAALIGTETLEDILALLETFLDNDGWTINASSSSTLSAEADNCYINFAVILDTLDDDNGPTGDTTSDDWCLVGRLGVNDTPVTPAGAQAVWCNDLTPPYSNYWFFSGGVGDPKYCHVVIQKSNGRFCHVSFGNLDKKGVTYTGGAFLFGVYWDWGFSSIGEVEPANIGSNNHLIFGSDVERTDVAGHNIFLGTPGGGIVIANTSSVTSYDKMNPLFDTGPLTMADMYSVQSRWMGHIFFLGPNPINGVTPLFEVPVMQWITANQRSQFYGTIPGFNYCSMIGRREAETVSFASDDYMVFPLKRALPWNPIPTEKIITSGPYGVALKKNV